MNFLIFMNHLTTIYVSLLRRFRHLVFLSLTWEMIYTM